MPLSWAGAHGSFVGAIPLRVVGENERAPHRLSRGREKLHALATRISFEVKTANGWAGRDHAALHARLQLRWLLGSEGGDG